MAMAMAALLLLLVAAPAVHCAQHTVQWNQGTDYSNFGSGQTFTVGDTLLFTYSGLHGVDVVTQSDYSNCNSGNALNSYSGGQTSITLSQPGPMYFMCPTMGHCSSGMKLSVNVVSAASTTSPATPTSPSASGSPDVTPPSDSSSSGSSSTTGSLTPSITTTTSPGSYSNGARGMIGNMNNWVMIGFSVVGASLVGFMG